MVSEALAIMLYLGGYMGCRDVGCGVLQSLLWPVGIVQAAIVEMDRLEKEGDH
ncbi:hypothetical protein [Salipiger mucosus]|uniref:Uncharacterized protein n=1 Tax=Salipiger mucosus DSM 16094 TaxID=1123237 RepID=S9S2U8_9RHOB|nr:hypothetical protein [Salipiger mucosus]EPX80494.1 hypothetical protein Salmuc_03811 [Salipiger mucosus DSM 16094]